MAESTTFSKNPAQFREDLLAIARTTLSSKVLAADKDYFAELAVSAVLRLKGSTDLDHIQIIKKQGGKLTDSYLDEGFILDKKIGVNCPHRMENAKIMIANTRECVPSGRLELMSVGETRMVDDPFATLGQRWIRTRSRSLARASRSTRPASSPNSSAPSAKK